jgi:hypothetical protein
MRKLLKSARVCRSQFETIKILLEEDACQTMTVNTPTMNLKMKV